MLFFFFKQKTAYEMRISDWSSDVCSSDLNDSSNWGAEGMSDDPQVIAQRDKLKRAMLTTLLISHGMPMLLAGDEFGQTQQGNNKIGRAWCRERVCKYV